MRFFSVVGAAMGIAGVGCCAMFAAAADSSKVLGYFGLLLPVLSFILHWIGLCVLVPEVDEDRAVFDCWFTCNAWLRRQLWARPSSRSRPPATVTRRPSS